MIDIGFYMLLKKQNTFDSIQPQGFNTKGISLSIMEQKVDKSEIFNISAANDATTAKQNVHISNAVLGQHRKTVTSSVSFIFKC